MCEIVPDTCVPTSTLVIGSIVPVAVTVLLMEPFFSSTVSYVVTFLSPERKKKKAPTITAMTMIMVTIFFMLFYN